MRKRLTFVSDLELRASGGGSYAVNFHAYRELGKRFEMTYGGPLRPKVPVRDEIVSKVRRKVFNQASKFHYYSPATLDRNAVAVRLAILPKSDAVFFRSSARWCRWKPTLPYFVYLDAVFHTFFRNTFDPARFEAADLERIYREEAAFLEGAEAVFFESAWGLEQAREAYGLSGNHYHAVGRGGVIEPPDDDRWDGGLRLLSVAMNFRQKGGDLVMEAYRRLKPKYPELSWHVVGAPPEGDWQSIPGIVYEGVLRPDEPEERKRLEELYANSFLLVHPTREDTSPLVLTEAAYFGCPSITLNRFAIPELVRAGATGVLLGSPASGEEVAKSIERLMLNREQYLSMRREARAFSLDTSSWNSVGEKMGSLIHDRLVGTAETGATAKALQG